MSRGFYRSTVFWFLFRCGVVYLGAGCIVALSLAGLLITDLLPELPIMPWPWTLAPFASYAKDGPPPRTVDLCSPEERLFDVAPEDNCFLTRALLA